MYLTGMSKIRDVIPFPRTVKKKKQLEGIREGKDKKEEKKGYREEGKPVGGGGYFLVVKFSA